jgi:hypothetical protein
MVLILKCTVANQTHCAKNLGSPRPAITLYKNGRVTKSYAFLKLTLRRKNSCLVSQDHWIVSCSAKILSNMYCNGRKVLWSSLITSAKKGCKCLCKIFKNMLYATLSKVIGCWFTNSLCLILLYNKAI